MKSTGVVFWLLEKISQQSSCPIPRHDGSGDTRASQPTSGLSGIRRLLLGSEI